MTVLARRRWARVIGSATAPGRGFTGAGTATAGFGCAGGQGARRGGLGYSSHQRRRSRPGLISGLSRQLDCIKKPTFSTGPLK